MQTIFGVTPPLGGPMMLDGPAVLAAQHRATRSRAGVYLAPEDRKRHGLVLPMTVAQNTSLPDIRQLRRGWVSQPRPRAARSPSQEVAAMRIKTPEHRRKVVNLSGGNQQKVVLGKWLAMSPRVLILDEPTRGIDVGAKAEIYRHMADLAAQGITILMVSSDMEESHRHERPRRRHARAAASVGCWAAHEADAGAHRVADDRQGSRLPDTAMHRRSKHANHET